jgi:hypothetical protein
MLPPLLRRLLRVWIGLLAAMPALALAQAIVTILDGEARFVHAKGSFAAVEGARLPPAVIVATDAKAALLRIEWPDGSAIDLGPATHALLVEGRLSERLPKAPAVYLLRGIAKFSGRAPGSAPALLSSGLEVAPLQGVTVLQATVSTLAAFAETGGVTLHERGAKAPLVLPAGQYWSRAGNEAGAVQKRPPPEWLAQLPRAWRDTLPLRRELMLARQVNVKPLPWPAYAELRDWLRAEPPVRRALVTQFTAWSQEPGLRSALIQHINEHREWRALVLPRPDPARTAASVPRSTP